MIWKQEIAGHYMLTIFFLLLIWNLTQLSVGSLLGSCMEPLFWFWIFFITYQYWLWVCSRYNISYWFWPRWFTSFLVNSHFHHCLGEIDYICLKDYSCIDGYHVTYIHVIYHELSSLQLVEVSVCNALCFENDCNIYVFW